MEDLIPHQRNKYHITDVEPWDFLKINSSHDYLIKLSFQQDMVSYRILLHDGVDMWKEEITNVTFLQKCKVFNKNIEGNPKIMMEHVRKSFEESKRTSTLIVTKPSDCQLLMSTKFKFKDVIPFHWTFELNRCSQNEADAHLTNPTYIMAIELLRRQKELYQIIERKDREIKDYKDQGYSVSRKHLQTVRFNRKDFENLSNINENFLLSCREEKPFVLMSSNDIINLYKSVMVNRQRINTVTTECHNSISFETVPVEGRAFQEPAKCEQIAIPLIMNNHQDADFSSEKEKNKAPAKDIEKERRETIRKRLKDEAERKNKKKKPKLNI